MKSTLIDKVFLIIIFVVLITSCSEIFVSGNGTLKGSIHIGPLCPVETIPPLPGCLPTEQTYKTWQLSVYNSSETHSIADIYPELSGDYILKLPAGNYKINFKDKNLNRIGGSNLPLTVKVMDGDTTSLDVNIDTGIR
ncbi:MAG: hypothetical protein ACOYM7_00925 [Paludibacter sp.]